MWQAIRRALGIPTVSERVVREAFRRDHPGERVAWTRLAADEEGRFVVGIYFGDTRPPRFKFYAVSKESGDVSPLDDDAAYRPKLWR